MPLDSTTLAGVHRILPGGRSVTVTPQNPSGTAIAVAGAIRRPWSQQETQGLGSPLAFEREVAVYLLPAENCSSVPKVGWKLTDADADWTILAAARELEGSIYRCPVQKQVS